MRNRLSQRAFPPEEVQKYGAAKVVKVSVYRTLRLFAASPLQIHLAMARRPNNSKFPAKSVCDFGPQKGGGCPD